MGVENFSDSVISLHPIEVKPGSPDLLVIVLNLFPFQHEPGHINCTGQSVQHFLVHRDNPPLDCRRNSVHIGLFCLAFKNGLLLLLVGNLADRGHAHGFFSFQFAPTLNVVHRPLDHNAVGLFLRT